MPQLFRKSCRVNGKLISAYGRTRSEAAIKLAAKLSALERGMDPNAATTVEEWFRTWYQTYKTTKGLTESSLKMYWSKYYKYIHPAIGNLPLNEVKNIDLQRLLNTEAGKSSSHVTKLRMILREMFRRAYATEQIFMDPTIGLDLPETSYKGHRTITEAEREAIYAIALDHPAGVWVLTLLNTGMRPGESAALTWADIDFEGGWIHIHAAKESGANRFKKPKTDAGIRDIPMRDLVRDILLPLRGDPDAPVFPNKKGGFLTTSNINNLWRSFRNYLDIALGAPVDEHGRVLETRTEGLKLYSLRHTFCSDLEKGGVVINLAKEMMGHSDIGTTSNIYTHTDKKKLHECIYLFDKVAGNFPAGAGPKDKTPKSTSSSNPKRRPKQK